MTTEAGEAKLPAGFSVALCQGGAGRKNKAGGEKRRATANIRVLFHDALSAIPGPGWRPGLQEGAMVVTVALYFHTENYFYAGHASIPSSFANAGVQP